VHELLTGLTDSVSRPPTKGSANKQGVRKQAEKKKKTGFLSKNAPETEDAADDRAYAGPPRAQLYPMEIPPGAKGLRRRME
jgi:hypothetical protein